MAKGDAGGGMMGRFGNAAMKGGNAIGAMQGQGPGGRFGRGGPMGMGMGMGNYQFGGGQMGNTPAMSYGGNKQGLPPMQGGPGGDPRFQTMGPGNTGTFPQMGGGMVGPSMPQIQPNPEFEKAYGNFRDQGMDFPGAMDAAQNQMGGSRGRGIMASFGGMMNGRRGMMF